MDDSTILPLDVFKIDRENPGLADPTYGLFQLPGGKFLVWSDVYSWHNYDSKEEASLHYESLKNSLAGEVVSLDPKDYPLEFRNNSNRDFTTPESNNQSSTPNIRAEKSKPNGNIGQDETKQQDRSETKKPNNNLPENLQKNSTDDSPSQSNINRGDADEPETEYAGGSLLEDVEHWIPSLFESSHKGVSGLKNELENDVDESNWFGRAIGASALDVMDTAMSFTEGIPLGLLDTRRIGEGLAEGTWEGAKKDISRALNVLPQGRLLKAADRALTASDVVESLNKGDFKTAGITSGLSVGSLAGGKAVAKTLRNKLGAAKTPKGKLIGKYDKSNTQTWSDSQFDSGDLGEMILPDGGWVPQKRISSAKEPKGNTQPDYYSKKYNISIENKRAKDILAKVSRRAIKVQAGNRFKHLLTINPNIPPKQWLVVDHRGVISGKSVEEVHRSCWKSFGGNSVFDKIFIVTNDGIFMF